MRSLGRPRASRLGSAPNTNCLSLDLSDDGTSCRRDTLTRGAVRVWSAYWATPLTAALPHAAAVPLVGFLPESRRLLTADSDGMIRIWELTTAGALWTCANLSDTPG